MALKYTGRSILHLPGIERTYKEGDIVPISQKDALNLINQNSRLHSFEIVNTGEDLEDRATKPDDKTSDVSATGDVAESKANKAGK